MQFLYHAKEQSLASIQEKSKSKIELNFLPEKEECL